MKCENFLEKIEDLYLKELSGSEEDRMSEHIATCPHCEDAWMDYQQIEKALTELSTQEQISSYTSNTIMQAAAAHLENNRQSFLATFISWFKLKPAYLGALALSVVAIAVILPPRLEKALVQEPAPLEQTPSKPESAKLSPDDFAKSDIVETTPAVAAEDEVKLLNEINLQASKGDCNKAKDTAKKIKSQKTKADLDERLKHCN